MQLSLTKIACGSGYMRNPRRHALIRSLMRITLSYMILLLGTIQLLTASTGVSQELHQMTVTMSAQQESLKTVLKRIEKKTGLSFVMPMNEVETYTVVSLPKMKRDIKTTLDLVLAGTHLGYRQINKRSILIYVKSKEQGKASQQELSTFDSPSIAFVVPQVTGRVTDEKGEGLPGVSILVKGTQQGAITDENGHFQLNVSPGAVLVFSFVGYETTEITVGNESHLEVALKIDERALEEVVVVGYGVQKKVNVIGSISTIASKELSSAVVPNVSNAISGRMPGVLVQQRSGEPGANSASILIRGKSTLGNNSPLVVIDGVQGRDLNSLNLDDVENISILKDASAAIYGARAANGVILVTTKSGKTDAPPIFNYRFSEGFLSPTKLPEMASSWEYAEMLREVEMYRGVAPSNMTFTEEDIEKFKSGKFPWTHPNTNWYKEALSPRSSIRNHNFSVHGGSKKIKYYASYGNFFEEGIYRHSANNFGRNNLKGRIDVEVNKYLSLGLDVNGSVEKRKSSVKSSTNIFTSIIRNYPYRHAIFPGTDKPGPDIEYGDQPIVTPSDAPGFDHEDRFRSNNIISATVKIPGVSGLKVDAFYSYDKYFRKRKFFEKPYTLYDFDQAGYLAAGNTGVENGEAFIIPYRAGTVPEPRLTDTYEDSNDRSLNLRLSYERTFKNLHNISGFVAYENAFFEGQGISAFRRYFNSDQLPYLFAGGDSQKDNSGTVSIDARANFISRINYDYNETYLLQIGFRRDGSIRFSEESGRWGNFPSVLAGWRPSEYNWWKSSVRVVDELKLKLSWAKMGNDLVPPFQYLSSYGFGSGVVFGSDLTYSPALYQSGTPNPFITWEVANNFNFGLESRLFNHSLTFELDFFKERRNNILVKRNASVPNFTGLTLPDENFGIVDNKGVEMALGYNGKTGSFSYNLHGTFSFARNKVIEFDEPERSVPWQVRTGKPQGAQLLYKSIGVFRDEEHVNSMPHVPGARPGDLIIEDYDKDGQITPDDRILIPLTEDPEIMFGLSGSFSYKSLSLSFLVQGVERAIRNVYTLSNQGTSGNYFKYDAVDRWNPKNPNATKPRAFDRVEEYWRQNYLTDYGFHKLGYARVKNVKLAYQLPDKFAHLVRMKQAEISFTGQNLLLIYNRNQIADPEVGNAYSYPLMSAFSIGGNFSF